MPLLSRRSALRLGLALPLATAARAQAAPIVITDALGRTITLKAPAERIVLGFNYEEYTAIAGPAGWDRVVGFGRAFWADWRPSTFARYSVPIPRLAILPDVGNTDDNSFNLEKVLSLRPDLVIMADWSFQSLGDQVRQLGTLGIPVLVIDYNAEIPARHIASTLALGLATGNAERANRLAETYTNKLADIQRRARQAGTRPKIYVELGQGGAGVIGNTYWQGMWGRLLDLIGADNIAAGHIAKAWGPLSPEYVLAANPDAIFIAGSSWLNQPRAVLTGYDVPAETTRARLAPYAQRQGWPQLSAIRNGQLHAIEHGLCRALFDYTAMYYLAKQIYPAQFADIDPVDELRQYHHDFLPVAFDGTWMIRASS
ncbi:ABC transporter substrate-binding protein [Acidisphaera sp. L21]|uniref:ABC transporter substrate-binding protein n=1 Tax=Acidisphaera sp. L21 TaxID=1641851 RepID=UPI00131D471F|nr:ABC transporter substrate-binding protein [Acidisphaera sp. L21]